MPPGPGWEVESSWRLFTKKADFAALSKELNIDQVAVRIMRNRGLETKESMDSFINVSLRQLRDPALLPDAKKACAFLEKKLADGAPIRVIGDYDVDGITSSCILVKVLSFLEKGGGKNISASIPDRITDGYGLGIRLVEEAHEEGVDTIITCDNGIAAADEIAYAESLGMNVIVTDHHEVPYVLDEDGARKEIIPECEAVVDPKREGCEYPFAGICGAVVAFKLCMLLLKADNAELEKLCGSVLTDSRGSGTKRGREQEREELLCECMQLCALATVCDVMELLDENRPIVSFGLKLMEKTKNKGLRALLDIKDLTGKKLTVYHMGFLVGPCLNSSGRIDKAMEGLALLLAESDDEAGSIAAKLDLLNNERKHMTEVSTKEAALLIEKGTPVSVIVAYLPSCHESLAGIVAGRLRERYARPAFVLTDSGVRGMLKGSGRSTPEYHMYESLHAVEDLLSKYGGHAMAAGFSLRKENLEEFGRRLNENCSLRPDELTRTTYIDADMPISYISHSVIRDIERLEPFGQGNSKPVFGLLGLKILGDIRIFGANRNVSKFTLTDDRGVRISAVYFGDGDAFRKEVTGKKLNILYYPQIDDYSGQERLQIKILEYKAV